MENEQHYIQGFNNGYILQEHNPNLLQKVTLTTPTKNVFVQGMIDGKEQFVQENNKNMLDELEQLRDTNRSIERGQGR